MKKLLLWLLLILNTPLIVLTAQRVHVQDITFTITEFGYPYIPNAAQVNVKLPIIVEGSSGKKVEFAVDAWYRANSPYLYPVPFFEIGVVPQVNLLKEGRAKLYLGAGTAYSYGSGGISIPAIFPISFQYSPYKALDLAVMLQSMIYGDGMITEITLTARLGPFFDHLFVNVGGAANIVYEWEQNLEQYSYGLSFGIGYRF